MLTPERVLAVPNRGATHLFLGHPWSETADKTCAEPGNAFSPGIGTCGISLWVGGADAAPSCADELPEAGISWRFLSDPTEPLVVSEYTVAGVRVRHELCQAAGPEVRSVDAASASLCSPDGAPFTTWLVVRGGGPAGARLERLAWDAAGRALTIGDDLQLVSEAAPADCTIVDTGNDEEPVLAWLRFDFGGPGELRYRVLHRPSAFAPGAPPAAASVSAAREHVVAAWQTDLPARVFAPDPRVAATWARSAAHLQAAMEGGMPRIGVQNYPVFWIRDGVIVLRALDLMGRPDLVRPGIEYLATLDFGGGFGAESDSPGQGVWALVQHARLTGDRDFLARVWPHVQRKAALIHEELTATRPVRKFSENRIPRYLNEPDINLYCHAAREGLIHGRMDHHSPDLFVNCWAWAGLDNAAWAANALGLTHEAAALTAGADALEAGIVQRLLPAYGNDRDPAVAPWPTDCFRSCRADLRRLFTDWYTANRLDPVGRRRPEPLWTYFEAAQIHNAVLLDRRDLAWACLDGMLEPDGAWDVSAWIEGAPEGNEWLPFENGKQLRGWLSPERARAGNMPHNWTSAEMIALLRDLFVYENGDELVLGAGVPPTWLQPGCEFGVRRLPTTLGEVSYTARMTDGGGVDLQYNGPAPYRVLWHG